MEQVKIKDRGGTDERGLDGKEEKRGKESKEIKHKKTSLHGGLQKPYEHN